MRRTRPWRSTSSEPRACDRSCADPIDGPGDVARWHAGGVRGVGLTWSSGNRYAGGNGAPGPLTPGSRSYAALTCWSATCRNC